MQAYLQIPVTDLVLKKKRNPDFPIQEIAEQLASRRKAAHKLPEWSAKPTVLLPALAFEQCSSSLTAHFKCELIGKGKLLIDLTGGLGVDTYFFAQYFERVIHVEPNADLQAIVRHNFTELGVHNVEFVNQTAETFIAQNSQAGDSSDYPKEGGIVVYIDPSRRDTQQQRVFRLTDCVPNIVEIFPQLFEITPTVWLKASPMLDIQQGIYELKNVRKVYAVAVENEMKELLFHLEATSFSFGVGAGGEAEITAVNLNAKGKQAFVFKKSAESLVKIDYQLPQKYLYEPNAAILKAGAFHSFAHRFNVAKLHPNSHLYTSAAYIATPARTFEILHICPYRKQDILPLLASKRANITVRNFPDSVAQIRQKLGLKEGGDCYIFATTNLSGKPIVLICKKLIEPI